MKEVEKRKNLGAKKKILKFTFTNGIINYYTGVEEVCNELGISRSTYGKWKQDVSSSCGRVEKIEEVDKIPEGYTNTKIVIEKKNIPREVEVFYKDGRREKYNNFKEADLSLGLNIGTSLIWSKREKSKQTPRMRKMGIIKIQLAETSEKT